MTYFPTGFRLEWMQECGAGSARLDELSAQHHSRAQSRPAALEPVLLRLAGCGAAEDGGGAQRRNELEPGGARGGAGRAMGGVVSRNGGARAGRSEPAGCTVALDAGLHRKLLWRAAELAGHLQRTNAGALQSIVSKQNYAASVGRLWDEGKQSRLLMQLINSAAADISCRGRRRWLARVKNRPVQRGRARIATQDCLRLQLRGRAFRR